MSSHGDEDMRHLLLKSSLHDHPEVPFWNTALIRPCFIKWPVYHSQRQHGESLPFNKQDKQTMGFPWQQYMRNLKFSSALVSYEWDFIWKLHMHWHAGRTLNLIRCSAICLIQIEANRIKLLRSPCGKTTHNALGRWILGYSLWTKQHAN